MRFPRRALALLGVAILALFGLTACGESGPSDDDVATIGGDAITKETFDHLLPVAYKQASQQQPGALPQQVPDAPKFKRCTAEMKKLAPEPQKGMPRPTDKTFTSQCKQLHKNASDTVMQFLVQTSWLIGEAKDRDISVSDEDVKKAFDKTRKQRYPTQEAFDQYLKSSGSTIEDALYQQKVQLIQEKLQKSLLKGTEKVTPKQIEDYYNKNKDKFAQQETRSMNVVMAKDEAKAKAAMKALKGGQSFKQVARKYSIDEASKATGGKLESIQKGQQEKTLDTAVFEAKKGKLTGPVKTQFGYYVFEVTKVTPSEQKDLKEVQPIIKQQIVSERQTKAGQTFMKDFEKKWKARTECAKGFVIESCKNAPKPKTSETDQQPEPAPAPEPAPEPAP